MRALLSLVAAALVAGGAVPIGAQARDTTRLRPVVVTATRSDQPHGRGVASTTVLDANALRSAGVADLTDALRAVPGLQLVRSGGPGTQVSLFLRGAESDYVRVLVDGVPVNEPGGAVDLSAWTLDGIERIEVVRGPASVLYGSDAVAGVVQLFTRRAATRAQALARASTGSFGTRVGDAMVATSAAGWHAMGSVARRRSDGIQAFNSQWWNDALSARMGWTGARTTVTLTGQQRRDALHVPTDGAGRVVDTNAYRNGRRSTIGMDATHRFGDRWRVALNAAAMEGRTRTDDQQDGLADTLGLYTYLNRGSVRRRVVEARVEARPRAELQAMVGAEWSLEAQHSRDSSNYGGNPAFAADRTTRAAWVQLAGGPSAVQFTLGARLDDNSTFGQFTTARAGVAARVADGWHLRGSLGSSFKAPTFLEQFNTAFTTGNPDLTPERGRVAELALGLILPYGRGEVSATAFGQRFTNLVQYAWRETGPHFFNVARARADGVELEASRWMGTRLQVQGASTWLSTEVVDAGLDEGAGAVFVDGQRLIRRPAHTWSLGALAVPHPRLSVRASALRTGTRDDRDFSTFPARAVVMPAFTRADIAATWEVTSLVRLLGRLDNLTDASYSEAFGFPAPGRQWTVGAEWRFGGPTFAGR